MTARQSCNLRTYDLRMLGTAAWLGRLETADRRDADKARGINVRVQTAKRELARLGIK